MFGGFRHVSRLRRNLYRASPVLCAGLFVAVPPHRRREGFRETVTSFLGFANFFIPKVPIPDLSILKRPLFKSNDNTDRSEWKNHLQADIVVGLDVGPIITHAFVVYFPKDEEDRFPLRTTEDQDGRQLEKYVPASKLEVVKWDVREGESSQAIGTGVVLSTNQNGKLLESIGPPPSEDKERWANFIPGFELLNTETVNVDGSIEYDCEEVLGAFLKEVRLHIEEHIKTHILPHAFLAKDKPKIKWFISNMDFYDRTHENSIIKRRFWRALTVAGFPTGFSDAGMRDAAMMEHYPTKRNFFEDRVDQQRAASMVELLGRTFLASKFIIATAPEGERFKDGDVLFVIDDTILGCISRIVRVQSDSRLSLVEYPELGLSGSIQENMLRQAYAYAVARKGGLEEGIITREHLPEDLGVMLGALNQAHEWFRISQQLRDYAWLWAVDESVLPEEVELELEPPKDYAGELEKWAIFNKDDMDRIIGHGFVAPFLMHLDSLLSKNKSVDDESQIDIVIVNDKTNNAESLGVVGLRLVEMLRGLDSSSDSSQTPLQISTDETDEEHPRVLVQEEDHPAGFQGSLYNFSPKGGDPLSDFAGLVRGMPNLGNRSFARCNAHTSTDFEMVFIGLISTCVDELHRMYLNALGWEALTHAYLPQLGMHDEDEDEED